jgi:hypothetical protein
MFAQQELTRLRDLKAVHRYRISVRRVVCAVQTERVLRPLRWVDRASALWQRIGPLGRIAAGPTGLWLLRALFRRRKLAGPLMRWGPTIWSIVQGFGRRRAAA